MKQNRLNYQAFRLFGLLGVLIGTLLFISVKTLFVQASPLRWANWYLSVTFPHDTLNVLWTVQTGHYAASGQPVPDGQATYDLSDSCVEYGDVVIDREVATFDGASYYECQVPDFAAAVQALVGEDESFVLDPRFRGGWASFAGHPDTGAENLVFDHPNIKFLTPISGQAARLQLNLGSDAMPSPWTSTESDPFQLAAGVNNLYSEYLCSSGQPGAVCYGYHEANSSPIGIDQQHFRTFPLFTDATPIYIGGSPASSAFFQGQIFRIDIDPGCYGDPTGCFASSPE